MGMSKRDVCCVMINSSTNIFLKGTSARKTSIIKKPGTFRYCMHEWFNLLMLTAAKNSLTTLMKS